MTQARPNDYWISPNALYIELNATGNPDYIQAACISGAQILVYIKDIITYDAGHNYRRWTLQASPTVFNSHTAKYVYAAIPKDNVSNQTAYVCFPSEQIDIYGKNAAEEQIGSTDYNYIFLQGIITSSGDNGTVNRDWQQRIAAGLLSSDEAIDAIGNESEWYRYSSVDQIVMFLKDMDMETGKKFINLLVKNFSIDTGGHISFAGDGKSLTGIADKYTNVASEDKIVTPKYLDDKALSRIHTDTAQKAIRFLEGLKIGAESKGIDAGGNATLGEVKAGDATLGSTTVKALESADMDTILQKGFGFIKGANGKYTLSVTDLTVWGKAVFDSLEIRKMYSVGGNVYMSGASGKIQHVETVYAADGTTVAGWRCYMLADDGTTATQNCWRKYDQARCQTFDIKEGVYKGGANRHYWRLVTDVSTENTAITETYTDADGKEQTYELYDGKKFAWIVLSATDCEDAATNNAPATGDTIVLDGHRMFAEGDSEGRDQYNDEERTNVMALEATGTNDGSLPRIAAFAGVTDYRHTTANEVFTLSPKKVTFNSARFEWHSADGSIVTTVNFLGPWQEGKKYGYYDQVSHGNALWTCIVEKGKTTTEEPTDGSAVWRKEISGIAGEKGDKGDDGVAYILQVTSDKGTVLVNGTGSLTLTGTLYKNGEDITSTVSENYWSWYRMSADTVDDAIWDSLHEGTGNVCTVTGDDVARVAQFGCRAYIPDVAQAGKGITVDSLKG